MLNINYNAKYTVLDQCTVNVVLHLRPESAYMMAIDIFIDYIDIFVTFCL